MGLPRLAAASEAAAAVAGAFSGSPFECFGGIYGGANPHGDKSNVAYPNSVISSYQAEHIANLF